MYERHKRRYSLCDISKADRTVDVVLLKVRPHLTEPAQSARTPVPGTSSRVLSTPQQTGKEAEKGGGARARLAVRVSRDDARLAQPGSPAR